MKTEGWNEETHDTVCTDCGATGTAPHSGNPCDCGYTKPVEKAWRLVTNVNDLAVDDEIIIAVKNETSYIAFNTVTGGITTISMSGSDAFTEAEVASVSKITLGLGSNSNSWSLKMGSNYIGYNGKKTDMKSYSNVVELSSWTITISDGKAKIVNVSVNTRFIGLNDNKDAFKAYATSNLSQYPQPSIYKFG